MRVIYKPKDKLIISRIHKILQIPNRDTTPKLHSINDDATLFRRCMLVGVLSQIESFSDTYFFSQMALISFCCFPSSIIINIAAMLHVFVRCLLYLLL